jgi:hypothetical protein
MSDTIQTVPARIIERALSVEQLTSLIQADLGDIQPFFWSAEISNNRLDFYFGRMAQSTLQNFANDAIAGVSFLDSHNSRNLGYGQSLSGTFETTGELLRTVANFYTVPGIRFSGGQSYASTDDFILAVKSRLARDVSVGFYGGASICDICGEDVWAIDWDNWRYMCPHMPGVEYPTGDQGREITLATFSVEDARLAEVSAVYDGATPGAVIEKANRMVENGQMPADVAHRVEVKYRVKLPEQRKVWAGVEPKRSKQMAEPTNDLLTQIRAILQESKAPKGNEAEGVRWLADSLRKAQEAEAGLLAETERLKPLAEDGQAYRADLIEETLKEGVRAMGDNFAQEAYEEMLKGASLARIKEIRDKFAAQAKATIPQGRQTTSDDETAGATVDLLNPKRRVPESSYSN